MPEIDIHGYKLKYDPNDGQTVMRAIDHMSKNMDKEEAHDYFRNAKTDSDRKTKLDFYDKKDGVTKTVHIRFDGNNYRIKRAS